MVDRDRIEHVFDNLIDQCDPAHEPGGIGSLSVHLATATAPGSWFADTGEGIPAEHVARIFEKFYRVPDARTIPAAPGLGLAIVREIVTAHGGRDRGQQSARQRREIYFHPAGRAVRPDEPTSLERRKHMDPKKRILIVDDEPNVRLMLSTALASVGYEVIEAEDGEARSSAAEQPGHESSTWSCSTCRCPGWTAWSCSRGSGLWATSSRS